MSNIAVNTDLSTAFWVPIVAIQIQYGAVGASLTDFRRRTLLWGHKLSAGSAQFNVPYRLNTQTEVNQLFGATSEIATDYAHFMAQMTAQGGFGGEVYGIVVAEPSGTAATHLITIRNQIDPATGAPYVDPNTGVANLIAQTSGYVDVYIGGWQFTANISQGDTFVVIAGKIATAITAGISSPTAPLNAPIRSAANGGTATVTITAAHVGLIGIDLPIYVNFNTSALRLGASPGTLLFANNAGGDGSVTLKAGTNTIQAAIANGDTPTVSAGKLTAAVNAGAYNVTAYDNSGATAGQVVLFYVPDRPVHRLTATVTGIAPQTATGTWGATGSGAPGSSGLAAALTAMRALPCGVWVSPWTDAATIGAMYNELEVQANGLNQKDQFLVMASNDTLTATGAIVTDPAIPLTNSPNYSVSWSPDDSVRGVDNAAREAAMIVAADQPNDSWDGARFVTNGRVPVGTQHLAVRPDPGGICNTAITTYHLTPIVVGDDGYKQVMRGTTTVIAADDTLTNWGVIRGLGFCRWFARTWLSGRFFPKEQQNKKLLKRVGAPQSPKSLNPAAVAECIGEVLEALEQGSAATSEHPACPADVIDGADDLRKLVQYQANQAVSGRVDVTFPTRVPPPLHQIGVVEQQR